MQTSVCVGEKRRRLQFRTRRKSRIGRGVHDGGGGGAAGAMPMIINLTYRATIVRLPSRALATDAAKEEANAPWRNMIC